MTDTTMTDTLIQIYNEMVRGVKQEDLLLAFTKAGKTQEMNLLGYTLDSIVNGTVMAAIAGDMAAINEGKEILNAQIPLMIVLAFHFGRQSVLREEESD